MKASLQSDGEYNRFRIDAHLRVPPEWIKFMSACFATPCCEHLRRVNDGQENDVDEKHFCSKSALLKYRMRILVRILFEIQKFACVKLDGQFFH
ncbi:MAG: hypothetical protein GY820_01215 [Gammaproteobacteria bacterium]|nr:hypothetical protein [Gammaproteobacteria bacterium]